MKKWTFDNGILLDENDEAIACTWGCKAATERNIKLMESAPEMYELIKNTLAVSRVWTLFPKLRDYVEDFIDWIDEEANDE